MDMFERDLVKLLENELFSTLMKVKSGVLKGKQIKGILDMKHEESSFGGRRDLLHSGDSAFVCRSEHVKKLDSEDRVQAKGKNFVVDVIKDDLHGVSQVVFKAEV